MFSKIWDSLFNNVKEKVNARRFELGKFHIVDLFNPYYIDRKTIYDFICYAAKKYSGKTIMDFGCGDMPYKALFCYGNYIGCDVKKSGHSSKHKKADVYYDGHVLPFETEKFDIILSTQVFEHVEHLDEIFKELVRCLKNDGYFIITVPFCYELHEKPYDFRRFTRYGIEQLFNNYSIELLEFRNGTDYKTTLSFLHCMYYDNAYRKKKSIWNFFMRYISSIIINLRYICWKKNNMNEDDDLSINYFVIGKKKSVQQI